MKTPRDYQEDLISYLIKNKNAALWVEMRLGKTPTVIWALKRLPRVRRVLVLAPNSALRGWLKELKEEGETNVMVLQGTKKQRKKWLQEGCKWNLLNHDGWRVIPEISKMAWDVVILDESASCIRYPDTQITQFMLEGFKYAKRRIALAGRPDPQNNLLAYWPQMAWAHSGSWMGCDNFYQFRHYHFINIAYKWRPKSGHRKRILNQVSEDAYVLRREHVKLDVSKVFEPRYVNLTSKSLKIYREAEERYVLRLTNGDVEETQWQLVQYQWLRQLAGGFVKKNEIDSCKLTELSKLLVNELSGEQVVIWCAYNHEVAAVADMIGTKSTWITGKVPPKERRRRVDEWERGNYEHLVVQVKCAETGEDLGVSDTAVYFSLPFAGLTWIQTQDRILGNLTKKGVLIAPILCEGTVDEDIYATLQHQDAQGKQFLDLAHERMLERHGASVVC